MTRTLSIIIPTYNEAASIETAIESALEQSPLEIIISDGDSQDATISIANRIASSNLCVKVIAAPRGRGRQLAAGAAIAKGDVLLFVHCDNVLECNALDQMKQAGWPNWGGFEQRIDDPRRLYRWLESGNAMRVRWTSRVFGDQGIFVQRMAYDQVNGFDDVDLMEDVMLSAKLKAISSAVLLPGKLRVDARRWHVKGVVRQTARNSIIQLAFICGVSPSTLRRWYG